MPPAQSDSPNRQRRVPKQERSISTVEAILQAAEELFLKDGFAKTTVEDILRRAGIGTGSFYDYFPNKTAVALALLESVSTEIAGDARKYFIDFGRDSIQQSLPKVVRRIFHRYKRHKNILINLVYSAAIKQYLSDDDPPFGEETFLDQLSTMMLGYIAYDAARDEGAGSSLA